MRNETACFIPRPFPGGMLSVALSLSFSGPSAESDGGRYPPPCPLEPGLSSPRAATRGTGAVAGSDRPAGPQTFLYYTGESGRSSGPGRCSAKASSAMSQPSPSLKALAADAAKEPRTLWERILTTTPVVLSVVATLLAGQSSAEMTRAQYRRSLAAQNQSKAADQWGFFQAKKTRKLMAEYTVELLEALGTAGSAEFDDLRLTLDELRDGAREIERSGEKPAKGGTQARGGGSPHVKQGLCDAAGRARRDAEEALQVLGRDWTPAPLAQLSSGQLPPGPADAAALERARQAIRERKPDDEIAQLVVRIKPEDLRAAIARGEAQAAAFDAQVAPVEQAARRFAGAAQRVTASGRAVAAAVRTAAAEDQRVPASERAEWDQLRRRADRIGELAGQFGTAAKVTIGRFTARRYDREAGFNQETAFLYEVQVRQNSSHAERHLARSRNFFYGMLGAQLAVTVSTLALAVRQKSLFWGLASVAGLGAIVYSVYVYLDLVP